MRANTDSQQQKGGILHFFFHSCVLVLLNRTSLDLIDNNCTQNMENVKL